ncbi:MAG: flagellin FliC [Pararheinheimera sp.]|nr:flagellin FliC [Rheinheimera sp.]
MALAVNTNVSALNAQRQLLTSGNALDSSYKRLSSGFRINSAADDSAGLQISNRLTSQINGLNQAISNANDGISVAQVAEGAMDEITTSLQRIRVLAVQSQNGINNSADRTALQKEVSALKVEISRSATNTQFGNIDLLKGDFSAKFLVGANAGQTISINLSRTGGGYGTSGLGLNALSVSSVSGASAAIASIDSAIKTIDSARADLGALQNRFQSTIRNLSNIVENVSAARSQIRDTDFAKETAELTRAQILQQASTTILSQANTRPQTALSLLG